MYLWELRNKINQYKGEKQNKHGPFRDVRRIDSELAFFIIGKVVIRLDLEVFEFLIISSSNWSTYQFSFSMLKFEFRDNHSECFVFLYVTRNKYHK